MAASILFPARLGAVSTEVLCLHDSATSSLSLQSWVPRSAFDRFCEHFLRHGKVAGDPFGQPQSAYNPADLVRHCNHLYGVDCTGAVLSVWVLWVLWGCDLARCWMWARSQRSCCFPAKSRLPRYGALEPDMFAFVFLLL